MRIIAGTHGGMNLLSPKGNSTRPITDRVKESIFSILYKYNMPEDCVVGDVFCGTGSFGLEALSRGAKQVTFVELDRDVVEILNKNIEKARFDQQSRVVKGNAFKVGVPVLPGQPKCNLVFVDPPYPLSYETDLKSRVGKLLLLLNEQVDDDGIVLVRTHERARLLDEYGRLKVFDRREWGNMAETFLRLEKDQPMDADSEDVQPGNLNE